jgi:pSer/pThr/pTyr-binding forkhead associated (FHA) protein
VIQLKILTGKKAGILWVARRFPVGIGRAPGNDLQLEEQGVWDKHLELQLRAGEGFVLSCEPSAITAINGQSSQRAVLANGDLLQIGSVKMEFWLGETQQRGLRWREWLTWALIAAISLGQVALIYWLLRQ